MHYYTVLEAANLLVDQRGWKLARCRRNIDGPARYIVFDENRMPMFIKSSVRRNFGFTLHDILARLCDNPEVELARTAQSLLQQLEVEE